MSDLNTKDFDVSFSVKETITYFKPVSEEVAGIRWAKATELDQQVKEASTEDLLCLADFCCQGSWKFGVNLSNRKICYKNNFSDRYS